MIRNAFEPWHLIILVLVIVTVFGWKRLPDAARSLGRSMRIFKSEVSEMKNDGERDRSSTTVDDELAEPHRTTATTSTTTRPTSGGVDATQATQETRTTRVTQTSQPAQPVPPAQPVHGAASGASSATSGDEFVVIDGVRYRREPGDTAPRA